MVLLRSSFPVEGIFLVLLVLVLVLACRLFAGSLDRKRIAAHFRERGQTVRSIVWAPFGTGWLGEKDSRIYKVHFEDSEGNTSSATAKTSMLSGVYLTEERAASTKRGQALHEESRPGMSRREVEDLQRENEQLRSELDDLRALKRDPRS
jgi:hypothetical protein